MPLPGIQGLLLRATSAACGPQVYQYKNVSNYFVFWIFSWVHYRACHSSFHPVPLDDALHLYRFSPKDSTQSSWTEIATATTAWSRSWRWRQSSRRRREVTWTPSANCRSVLARRTHQRYCWRRTVRAETRSRTQRHPAAPLASQSLSTTVLQRTRVITPNGHRWRMLRVSRWRRSCSRTVRLWTHWTHWTEHHCATQQQTRTAQTSSPHCSNTAQQ